MNARGIVVIIVLRYFIAHPLEFVSRHRDPQLQMGEDDSHLFDLKM